MLFDLFKKKKKITVEFVNTLTEEQIERLNKMEEARNKFIENNNKYYRVIEKHYEILEKLKFNLYSKAINEPNIKNEYTRECLKLCYKDMKLLPELVEYWKKDCEIRNEEYNHPSYGSHIIYVKLLEKLEKYNEAIEVCDYYINNGFDFDGTKGGLKARKEKILKKMNNK